ncbi:MAG TPA: DUF1844 domain-containing protein [Jatrophihabitans sp.]|nr:DUF1844 domain-containing protein [Jatrophihabitans sp.]
MAQSNPNRARKQKDTTSTGIPGAATPGGPGSASQAHPLDAIPLPAHGFDRLDFPVRELATIPAADVISRAAALIMAATAEKLGLTPNEEPDIDLDEARRLIDSLAGLLAASQDHLGEHREPLREGLRTVQTAFREASAFPDAPGEGPGERFTVG